MSTATMLNEDDAIEGSVGSSCLSNLTNRPPPKTPKSSGKKATPSSGKKRRSIFRKPFSPTSKKSVASNDAAEEASLEPVQSFRAKQQSFSGQFYFGTIDLNDAQVDVACQLFVHAVSDEDIGVGHYMGEVNHFRQMLGKLTAALTDVNTLHLCDTAWDVRLKDELYKFLDPGIVRENLAAFKKLWMQFGPALLMHDGGTFVLNEYSNNLDPRTMLMVYKHSTNKVGETNEYAVLVFGITDGNGYKLLTTAQKYAAKDAQYKAKDAQYEAKDRLYGEMGNENVRLALKCNDLIKRTVTTEGAATKVQAAAGFGAAGFLALSIYAYYNGNVSLVEASREYAFPMVVCMWLCAATVMAHSDHPLLAPWAWATNKWEENKPDILHISAGQPLLREDEDQLLKKEILQKEKDGGVSNHS